jgi:uncharacterized protein YfdQ (DUF2303 family)
MNDEAIKRIEQLVAAGAELPATDVPVAVLPNGTMVQSLEKFLERPRQMRRTFKTDRLTDFLTYATEECSTDASAVFVQSDGSGAKAVIDYGRHDAPQWGQHQAVLNMQHTPEFAALLDACAAPLSQRELTDWLEDWADIIQSHEGSGLEQKEITNSVAVQRIRGVEIKSKSTRTHSDEDFKASVSGMDAIEASAKGSGSLPSLFAVTCSIYPDTEPRTVRARLSLRTGDEKPSFRMRILSHDALMLAVAREVEKRIREEMGGVRVFIGGTD